MFLEREFSLALSICVSLIAKSIAPVARGYGLEMVISLQDNSCSPFLPKTGIVILENWWILKWSYMHVSYS